MDKIDYSWKWRTQRKKSINMIETDQKIIVVVSRRSLSYNMIDITIKLNDLDGKTLYAQINNGSSMSCAAYLTAYIKLWNERIIKHQIFDYSESDRKVIRETYNTELDYIDDVWAQEEALADTHIRYYELSVKENYIVDWKHIPSPYSGK